ncbi:hypothetical protein PIB30_091571 [Stylosanthes scabra]|uniref:Uncharacterized protein n=1 Tax=Stylosanthes scabra TaxID=79078 RepID=A0ABU6QV24_9FABA|nr:hypothetical protein [Stylosanthes scabra]
MGAGQRARRGAKAAGGEIGHGSSFHYARLNYSIVKDEELCSPGMRIGIRMYALTLKGKTSPDLLTVFSSSLTPQAWAKRVADRVPRLGVAGIMSRVGLGVRLMPRHWVFSGNLGWGMKGHA